MTKLPRFACLALVLGFLLGACGDDDESTTSAAAAEDQPVRGFSFGEVVADKCSKVGGAMDLKAKPLAKCTAPTKAACDQFTADVKKNGTFIANSVTCVVGRVPQMSEEPYIFPGDCQKQGGTVTGGGGSAICKLPDGTEIPTS